jgi:hypothetical protein
MGVHNIKLESEVFQTVPQFQYQGWTPVETKPENSILQQLVSQLSVIQSSLNQLQQTFSAQGQWHIPSRTPIETKIDPTLTGSGGGQWNFPSRTPIETKIDPSVGGGYTREMQFHIPNRTPVETKVDPSLLHQVANHLAEAGQAFTRLAEAAVEGQGLVEEVRKLNQRVNEMDGKLAAAE